MSGHALHLARGTRTDGSPLVLCRVFKAGPRRWALAESYRLADGGLEFPSDVCLACRDRLARWGQPVERALRGGLGTDE